MHASAYLVALLLKLTHTHIRSLLKQTPSEPCPLWGQVSRFLYYTHESIQTGLVMRPAIVPSLHLSSAAFSPCSLPSPTIHHSPIPFLPTSASPHLNSIHPSSRPCIHQSLSLHHSVRKILMVLGIPYIQMKKRDK